MTLTLDTKLNAELERLKENGHDFSPADLGKKFGTTTKQITAHIHDRPDVYRTQKCSADRRGYKSSVWSFRKVPV